MVSSTVGKGPQLVAAKLLLFVVIFMSVVDVGVSRRVTHEGFLVNGRNPCRCTGRTAVMRDNVRTWREQTKQKVFSSITVNQGRQEHGPRLVVQQFFSSWKDFEEQLPNLTVKCDNISIDSALSPYDKVKPNYSNRKPTLFRERHGWCPYSERTWLALEYKNLSYDTVRIDNTGPGRKPSYFSGGTTPQMRWPIDGKQQGESLDIMKRLDELYPDTPSLFDNIPASVSKDDIDDTISKFRSIFPSGARPSSRAAFLFSWNGEPLFQSDFEKTLERTNELLGEGYYSTKKGNDESAGPFFCGSNVLTAADVAWVPFLERYSAQLPCFYDTLNVRDETKYPHLHKWFTAMETQVSSYRCRVMGDPSSWRKVLTMAGYGNAGNVPSTIKERMMLADHETNDTLRNQVGHTSLIDQTLWSDYQSKRPWLANTPAKEAASVLIRNRDAIKNDVLRFTKSPHKRTDLPTDDKDIDQTMLSLVSLLCMSEGTKDDIERAATESASSPYLSTFTSFLDERMCIPRDMGAPCALTIKRIAAILHQ